MKKIKVIIFDAYGTLFDVNSAAEKCKEKIGDKWESFANYWRTTQLEYTWLRSLMKRHKDFWQVTEDSLDKSLLAFKIDPKMRSELLNLYKILNTFPEVKGVLKNLKEKKYKIKPSEVTFLSANTWDVSGAGNYGYNSVWVNRNNAIFDNLDFKPKNEINNLTQLLDLI